MEFFKKKKCLSSPKGQSGGKGGGALVQDKGSEDTLKGLMRKEEV